MPKVEGARRKLSVKWIMLNKIENMFQVTCKFCNDAVSAKVKRMYNLKKHEINPSSKTVYNNETSNEIEVFSTQKRKLLLEDSHIFVNNDTLTSGNYFNFQLSMREVDIYIYIYIRIDKGKYLI